MDEITGYNSAYKGSQIDSAVGTVLNKGQTWDNKQDKVTGLPGQIAGFDDEGNMEAQNPPDTGVITFNDRTGAVVPQAGDYTAEMVGARSGEWMPSAEDVGARPNTWTPSAADTGAVPVERTVNGHALDENITLNATDVGARADTWMPSAEDVGAIPASQKGTASGVAELDSTGRVPSTQLPSYVDDVEEYTSLSAFPPTGEDGKIYVAEDSNLTYRWSGSGYVPLNPTLALGETSQTAYRGDRGKTAYDHSQITTGNPHGTTATDVGAVPVSTTVNGKALNGNITLDADDIGARANTWMPTAGDVGAVPTSRTVNSKALSTNITLTASDVGAASAADVEAAKPLLRTAMLTTSGWSSNSQTVTVSGVVASSSAQLIYVSPANKASATAWGAAGVFCSAQGANSLTFVCDSTPTENISVNISIQEAQA